MLPVTIGTEEKREKEMPDNTRQLSFHTSADYPLCWSDWARPASMGAKVFLMRMGMRRMFSWQNGLTNRLMRGMGQRVVAGMVPCVLEVPVPVHAG